VRRIALGLTAALVTARAFWPSEPDLREGAGSGIYWVFLVFIALGLALTSALVGGRFRFRWSWTDAMVIVLMSSVAVSASHALDRRPAINLAWEWVALGFVYLLLRNLPRTRDESSALAGVMVATAFAVSAYGLYQVMVELPLIRAEYLRNPGPMLARLNIAPGGRGEELLRNRLVGSTEVFSTFGLANSLAGFIVGPLVLALAVAFRTLSQRDKPESRRASLMMAAPIILVLLVSLILTKSRSAWLGILVATILLGWRARKHVPARGLVALGLASALVLAALIVAGLRARFLDREVLTQSTMSLRYRWEYWQGAWGVISGGATSFFQALKSPSFWWGVGPGNFGGPYLRFKLPEASEEIVDPHNLLLEVWATAGFWALLALAAALAFGLWNLLGRGTQPAADTDLARTSRGSRRESRRARSAGTARAFADDQGLAAPSRHLAWLVARAGVGGWALVVLLGGLNPFQGDLFYRWLILGAAWLLAVFTGAPLWRRLPVSGTALGAAVLAVTVNLLAAGGIGISTVAMGLWSMLAIGLNLRDDRPCGQLREYDSRVPPFVLAVAWAALLGTFVGLVSPYWWSERFIAEAEMARDHRPPDLDRADAAYRKAIEADGYYIRPWRELAHLHFLALRESGDKLADDKSRWSWKTIPYLYQMAATPPRNPSAWSTHSERAAAIHQMVNLIGSKLEPIEMIRLRGEIVKSTRTATRLNPTSAELHARLAHASADINMYQDAVDEATEALRLDRLTPHLDRKLPPQVREHLQSLIPTWEENAAKAPIANKP
jgi:O-antigen ligase